MHIYLDDLQNINTKLPKYYFLNNYKLLSIKINLINNNIYVMDIL